MPNFRRNLAVKIATPGGDNPLLLTLVGTPPFYRGVAVSGLALQGKGGTPGYAYTIISGSLPPGLSLDGTSGAITGTPTTVGHYAFVAKVQDAAANVFNKSVSIDIKAQLFMVGGPPTDGEVGEAYSYQFVVRDGSGTTLTSGYSITGGNLPAGLSMNSAGLITGTPTAPEGISYATLTVTDGIDTLVLAFNITIYTFLSMDFEESRDPPNGWGGGAGTWLPSMIRGQLWQAHIVVSGGRPPYSFNESLVNPLPSGINIVAAYRRLVSGKTMDAAAPNPKLMAIGVTDSLGAFLLVQRAFFIVDTQQGRITPQKNGVDVGGGIGATNLSLKEGANVTITASNDGSTMEYEISATGGGSSGIQTINGVSAGTGGDIPIDGIGIDSNGDLYVENPTPGVTYTDTGILVTGGAIGGVAIVPNIVASEVRGMSLGHYAYATGNWQLWVYPAPGSAVTFTLDVRKTIFTANSTAVPGIGNSIVAAAPPTLTGGSSYVTTTGSQSTWTGSPMTKGDMLTVIPTVNTGNVQWYCLFIPARRTF